MCIYNTMHSLRNKQYISSKNCTTNDIFNQRNKKQLAHTSCSNKFKTIAN